MTVRDLDRFKLIPIAALVLLAVGGCVASTAPAGGLQVTTRPATTAPTPETGPMQVATSQRLRIELGTRARMRRLMALPTSWDVANVTFNSPTKLTGPSVLQIPFPSFLPSGPNYVFIGDQLSTPTMPPLRPGTDYTIMADMETSSPLQLEAYGVVPGAQTIDAGSNSFVITMAPTGPQGTEIPISAAAGAQASPVVAYDAMADEALIAWVDGGQVLARRVDNAGMTAAPVTVCASGTASAPTVAYNASADVYMVAWADTRNGHSDIYFRTVSPADALGTETALDHTGGHTIAETQPNLVAGAGADRYLLSWVDARNNGTSGLDIYAYRVSSTGALSTLIQVAISPGATDQLRPVGCYVPTLDRFVVGFEDGGDLRFQRINAMTGATLDGVMGASLTAASGAQDQLSLAFNSKDDLVLAAWRDGRAAPTQIYYGVVEPVNGNMALADTPLTSGTTAANLPCAGFCSGHGDYAIMFADGRNGSDQDVFLRRFKRDGVTAYGEQAISTIAGDQRPGGLALAQGSDQFFGTWEDDRGGATTTDIYAQRLR